MRMTTGELILVLAAVAIAWGLGDELRHSRQMRAARHEQFLADYRAGVAGGARDHLDALVEATREDPRWGPGAEQPVSYGVRRLPLRIALDECGCLWFDGGWWSPCTEHDIQFELAQMEREQGQ